ncbi:MAG: hypothetical protein QM681_08110 [Novosphingobium sp.]
MATTVGINPNGKVALPMMKRTILVAMTAAFTLLGSTQAMAGTRAAQSVVGFAKNKGNSIQSSRGSLPRGLVNALGRAGEQGRKGLHNAVEQHFKSRGC